MEEMSLMENESGDLSLQRAVVFVEDALKYRSIHHKVDKRSLHIYRIYYSSYVQYFLACVICVILGLAFMETPSSFTQTADPRLRDDQHRWDPPCGLTQGIELLCLLCFLTDLVVKGHFFGKRQFIRSKWLMTYAAVLVLSFFDLFISLSFVCREELRIRRLLRPFFLLQYSSLMKKTLRAIKRTLPEVLSVLFLLALHLYFFVLLGMLLFPKPEHAGRENGTDTTNLSGVDREGQIYFPDIQTSLRSLFVLLTTANNPDVMINAYMENRAYAIFFIVFLVIGLYCFMNLLTAIIYNQFRGYLSSSLQSSFFRRKVALRAAFEVLVNRNTMSFDSIDQSLVNKVSVHKVRQVIQKAKVPNHSLPMFMEMLEKFDTDFIDVHQFQELFGVLFKYTVKRRPVISMVTNPRLRSFQFFIIHRYFNYFGNFMICLNVILMTIALGFDYERSFVTGHSTIAVCNYFFILYYTFEQVAKVWALGWQRYCSKKGNIYDGCITIILAAVALVDLCVYGPPFVGNLHHDHQKAMFTRVLNIVILFRLLRIISNIEAFSLVAQTLTSLLRNLKPIMGIIIAIYYVFAIFGMMLFAGKTDTGNFSKKNVTSHHPDCGSFGQLLYYANNFDDFAASLVVLWDVMVVNNWHVFLKEYAKNVGGYSQLYFLAWYLVSVIICINVFIALILEAFICQWDKRNQLLSAIRRETFSGQVGQTQSEEVHFHQLFNREYVEPSDEEIMSELLNHEHLPFR